MKAHAQHFRSLEEKIAIDPAGWRSRRYQLEAVPKPRTYPDALTESSVGRIDTVTKLLGVAERNLDPYAYQELLAAVSFFASASVTGRDGRVDKTRLKALKRRTRFRGFAVPLSLDRQLNYFLLWTVERYISRRAGDRSLIYLLSQKRLLLIKDAVRAVDGLVQWRAAQNQPIDRHSLNIVA